MFFDLADLTATRKTYAPLDLRRQETLLDLAFTEPINGLTDEVVALILARDWDKLIAEHRYVRYAGHAPDHARNKAFAARWQIP